ncbi:hypothetical protein HNR44_001814 [Geomicrobium halophilum]|uniref:Loader and inhibitor of phage G40P n=1 Tax=Geomicrobium halophilum TaxID=549000 RepID=A0A841PRP2_9BACL|nr:replicative helicase loader/inhibitor [Geomicrobium halophilum]MBB6449836.1 hypothetical protein [Geomicrobium halophilum]
MEYNQALDILESISAVYPRFELSEKKVKIIMPALLKMDYEGVMANVERHVTKNPFPPTIADIAAYPVQTNENVEKWREWELEASKVSQERKRQLIINLQKLLAEKASDRID